MFDGFLGWERELHLAVGVTLSAPTFAGDVVGKPGGFIFEGFEFGWGEFECPVTGCPSDAAFDESVEAGFRPGALVVAPCSVEDASFAVCSDPGPGFGVIFFLVDL